MGHRVIRLPPYHCELNPLELIWAQVKRYAAMHNTSFKISNLDTLCQEAVANVSVEDWVKACGHVIKEEKNVAN